MRLFVAVLLVVVVLGNVVNLTPKNFDQYVDGDRHVLVKFFAPWCGHCKRMAPAWMEAATLYKGKSDVVIAEVNCDEHRDLCSKYGVKGFPTLKYFPKGSVTDTPYSGGRDVEDIMKFLNANTGHKVRSVKPPSFVKELTGANFDSELKKTKCTLVKFFAPWCGHCKALAPKFEEAAAAFAGSPEMSLGEVNCDEHSALCQKFGVKGYPTLKTFCDDKEPDTYSGARETSNLIRYSNLQSEANRNEDGTLEKGYGRIESIDVSRVWDSATRVDEIANIEKQSASADRFTKPHYLYYLRVGQRISERGEEYPQKELNRLTRMISASQLSPEKLHSFRSRVNILSHFLEQKPQ